VRSDDQTSVARIERDFLGALLVEAERGPVNLRLLTLPDVGDFVGPHAPATYQELLRLLRRREPVDRHQLVAGLVTHHRATRAAAHSYVNGLIADAPPQPHLNERARRVREAASRRRETPRPSSG